MSQPGFFGRLKERLGKTRSNLVENVKRVLGAHSKINDAVFEELEETLIEADVGVETTMAIVEDLREKAKTQRLEDPQALVGVLKEELIALLTPGKLAAKLTAEGKKVILGAADTFRAAAAEQLTIWSERSGADIIKHANGADPASVAFDATDAALAREADNLLIDTAGRLHTKVNLMEELKKIQRVVAKRLPGAPHDVLLVLDATTGQNGLQQAKIFTEALNVSGIILTKLDGTAKGGMVIAIQKQLGIPIKMIGVGEGVGDLAPFDPVEFVEALFS